MTPHQVRLVQASFATFASAGDAGGERVFAELFAIDASLRPLFKADMRSHARVFMATLSGVIDGLSHPEAILEPLAALAARHTGFGVTASHYGLMGNALLRALKQTLGPSFTPETRAAWVEAYKMIAELMREAAYGPAADVIRYRA